MFCFQGFDKADVFTTWVKRGYGGMSAAATVRANMPHGGSQAMALTSDSAAHEAH